MKVIILSIMLFVILFLIGIIFVVIKIVKNNKKVSGDEFDWKEDSTLNGSNKVVKLKG